MTIEIGLALGYLAPRIDFDIKLSSRNRMSGFGRNYSASVGKGAAGPGTLGPAAGAPGWGGGQPDAPNCFECLLRLSDNAYIKIFIHLVLRAKMKCGKMQSSAVKPSRDDPSAPSTKPTASATTEMRIRISLLHWRIGHRLKQLVGRFATPQLSMPGSHSCRARGSRARR